MDFIGLYIAYGRYKWPLCFDIVFLTENHVWRGTKCEVGCISRAGQLISDDLRIYQLNQLLRLIYQQKRTMRLAEYSVLRIDA